MAQSDVTIVVVPRDHFSDTQASLASLCAQTPACPIVYVDAGSPPRTARYLREQSIARGFDLIRVDHYVTPNHARNLGAARVCTRYVVFVDNDVIVAPGWLPPLVECADETGASIVGPLNFERRPLLQTVHFAGGDTRIEIVDDNGVEHRRLIDRIHKLPVPAGRTRTESAEFHCMLVRVDVLRALGGLDENMLSTRENIDFCLAVSAAGGTIYLEPESKITYLPPNPLRLRDVPFFALRWSDLWDLSSFHHLRDKWRLDEDEYFLRQYKNLGWRRQGMMMRGVLLRWAVPWRLRSALERWLRPLERRVNAHLVRRHARRYGVQIDASIARSDVSMDAKAAASDRPVHLLVVPWDIDHPGGIEQVATNLYERFDASGQYSPEILVLSWPHRTPVSMVKNGRRVSYLRVRFPIAAECGLRTFAKWLVSLPFELLPLVRYLRDHRISTINIHYPSLASLQFVLASMFVRSRPRIVLSFHGLDLVNASRSRGIVRFAWTLLMRCAHAVTTCSSGLQTHLAAWQPAVGARATTIHNGVDIDDLMRTRNLAARVHPRLAQRRFILCVASLENKKGGDVLLHALRVLRDDPSCSDVMLALVGPERGSGPALVDLASRLGLSDAVVFCGLIAHDDLHAYYEAASVFSLPSRSEPFGIVLLEAGAFRCPVVATAVGGIPEIITDGVNGRLVPAEDADALATRLRDLLIDSAASRRLGQALRERVETHFSWKRAGDAYLALCSSPIDLPSPRRFAPQPD